MTDSDQTLTRPKARAVRRARTVARLCVVYPPEQRRVYELKGREVTVGRSPGLPDWPAVKDHTVSRQHLKLIRDSKGQSHWAEDLGSRNGSWVDGDALGPGTRVQLRSGSVVRLGDVLAVYECAAGLDSAEQGLEAVLANGALPGQSAAMRRLRQDVARAAGDPSPVLLVGETGTGKEFVSTALHTHSRRAGPRQAVNCAELTGDLVESQLFGHERGAFTGATERRPGLFRAADRGTLFLDEVGELPMRLQPKLLRALQEGEVRPVGSTRTVPVDVRVVAATNRALRQEVEDGTFRRDLYARLALWEIQVPSLRERRADLLDWLERLTERWCTERRRPVTVLELDPDAAERIMLHAWPDNLRGLDRLVHRLAVLGRPVMLEDLSLPAPSPPAPSHSQTAPPTSPLVKRPPPGSKEELAAVMAEHEGSVRAVARYYGRDRRQIYRWLDAFDLRGSSS